MSPNSSTLLLGPACLLPHPPPAHKRPCASQNPAGTRVLCHQVHPVLLGQCCCEWQQGWHKGHGCHSCSNAAPVGQLLAASISPMLCLGLFPERQQENKNASVRACLNSVYFLHGHGLRLAVLSPQGCALE